MEQHGRGLTLLAIRLAAMGDILRALPAIRLLRRGLPEARLLVAVDDRWEQVLAGHGDIDGLLLFPRKRLAAASPLARPAKIAAWRRRLRAEKPDLTVDFHGNLRSGLSAWLSGAPVRLGHAGHQQKEGNSLLTTHRVEAGERRRSRRELERRRRSDAVADELAAFMTGILVSLGVLARSPLRQKLLVDYVEQALMQLRSRITAAD